MSASPPIYVPVYLICYLYLAFALTRRCDLCVRSYLCPGSISGFVVRLYVLCHLIKRRVGRTLKFGHIKQFAATLDFCCYDFQNRSKNCLTSNNFSTAFRSTLRFHPPGAATRLKIAVVACRSPGNTRGVVGNSDLRQSPDYTRESHEPPQNRY